MIKALSGNDNVKVSPLFTVCCPQARRPVCPSKKALRRQGRAIVEQELTDACAEIQSILSGGANSNDLYSPSVSAVSSPFAAFTFLAPSPFTEDHQMTQQLDAAEGQSSLLASSTSSPSLPSSETTARSFLGGSHKPSTTTQLRKPLRIKLSESVSAIPNFDDSYSSISAPTSASLPNIPAPVPTPPLRSHNPLPYNSPFSNRQAPEGIEFGLLSVSPPPPLDDEDSFSRFERLARIRRTMWKRHRADDADDGAVGSSDDSVGEDFDMY